MPLPSQAPTAHRSALNQLPEATASAVRGLPVGGLWRLRERQIEIRRFGGEWSRAPLSQLQRAPRELLIWNRQLVLAPE